MNNARRYEFDVKYNNVSLSEDIGANIESMTYIDSSADSSDSIEITLNATEKKWIKDWMPETGATISAMANGSDWENPGDQKILSCGLFVLDDISYSDLPDVIQMGGVSKPGNSDFSEAERKTVWKNTSIKRIGSDISSRYGLAFAYDGDDYDIESVEQDGTDSSFYNELCTKYGLVLKIYAMQLWVYDREKYKTKPAIKTYYPKDIIRGSFQWSTSLAGSYTGGYFSYTDPDKDIDIVCSIGGGTRTKDINQRATSVLDASIQLCAAINQANHSITKISFSVPGEWLVSSGNNIQLDGYGKMDGKYFVDKVTHSFTRSGGFKTTLECSKIMDSFHYWEVGGTIQKHEDEEDPVETYTSVYESTSPAANADSQAAGGEAGTAVTLDNAPFYYTSTSESPSSRKSGTYYFYDGILINGRYRITNTRERCGKLPVGKNVTGWVPASFCK